MRQYRWFFIVALLGLVLLCPKISWAAGNPRNVDSDGDGLSDFYETNKYFTDPFSRDTDNDGLADGDEAINGLSPRFKNKKLLEVDSDDDGLNDAWELTLGTNLMNPDSDGDHYKDGVEVMAGYDPLNPNPIKVEKVIKVNQKQLRLQYEFGGRVLGDIPVSTGKKSTPTPVGEFKILEKIPVKRYTGPTWDYPNTKWNLFFVSARGWRFYIHGAYWHNKFGAAPVSGGCVNVRYADMEPLYKFAAVGTKVIIEKI